ncbi:hypothetical protein ABTE74_20365, partial [Acinetobacter baumannii]
MHDPVAWKRQIKDLEAAGEKIGAAKPRDKDYDPVGQKDDSEYAQAVESLFKMPGGAYKNITKQELAKGLEDMVNNGYIDQRFRNY